MTCGRQQQAALLSEIAKFTATSPCIMTRGANTSMSAESASKHSWWDERNAAEVKGGSDGVHEGIV